MKDNWNLFLLIVIPCILLALLIVFISINLNERDKERESVCKNIGNKIELYYYSQGHEKCGWSVDCSYQCKFIDNNGGIVIKDVQ